MCPPALFHPTTVDYIGQAVHTTLAPNYYNDTINLSIAKTDVMTCMMLK